MTWRFSVSARPLGWRRAEGRSRSIAGNRRSTGASTELAAAAITACDSWTKREPQRAEAWFYLAGSYAQPQSSFAGFCSFPAAIGTRGCRKCCAPISAERCSKAKRTISCTPSICGTQAVTSDRAARTARRTLSVQSPVSPTNRRSARGMGARSVRQRGGLGAPNRTGACGGRARRGAGRTRAREGLRQPPNPKTAEAYRLSLLG